MKELEISDFNMELDEIWKGFLFEPNDENTKNKIIKTFRKYFKKFVEPYDFHIIQYPDSSKISMIGYIGERSFYVSVDGVELLLNGKFPKTKKGKKQIVVGTFKIK